MRLTRLVARTGLAVAVLSTGALTLAPSASAGTHQSGTRSLATVLAADKSGFDHDGADFDILSAAVTAVLKAKPSSKVAVLADGTTPVTAFLPTDRAFGKLVKDITGKAPGSEKATFEAVASLGIPTVETVLLYHVVPGATITAKQALKADGVALKTAQGGSVTVDVCGSKITLIDADKDDRDPRVIKTDLNAGNRQIAHVIDRVLRPVNLP